MIKIRYNNTGDEKMRKASITNTHGETIESLKKAKTIYQAF
jgi:hypothetical protein